MDQLQALGAETMDDVLRLNVDEDLANSLPVLKRPRLGDHIIKKRNESIGMTNSK